MNKFIFDNLPTSEAGKRMLSRVSPVYENSYVMKWLCQVLGIEWDEARKLVLSLREQFFTETVTWGIEYQEHKYSIVPDTSLSLEERRARLKRKKPRHLPISPGQLQKYFADFWGVLVKFDETYRAGHIKMTFDSETTDILRKEIVSDFLRKKPAHLILLTELFTHFLDTLTIDESRNMIVNIMKSAKEIYQWRGRFFDSSWTFTPQVTFNNSWLFDGQYKFDNIPIGEVDKLNNFFRFNGDWIFGINNFNFGYPISRKIIWGTEEPDELLVNLQSVIRDKYEIILPFERFGKFDGKRKFGLQNAPIDSDFLTLIKPILFESINLTENQNLITKINVILQEIYPLARARFFNNTWRFADVWKFGGEWLARFGDLTLNPCDLIQYDFFDDDKKFGDWKFKDLPFAEAFFSENDAENLHLDYNTFSPEFIKPAEEKTAKIKINFDDNIFSLDTWSDKKFFQGFKKFGEGQIYFKKPPDFGENKTFNTTWAFGSTERFFNSDWQFGSAELEYKDDWNFGGDDFFGSKYFEENFDTKINTKLFDCLEHSIIFGNSKIKFNNSWQFGTAKNIDESLQLEIIFGLKFSESWSFGIGARLFNSDWNFGEDSYCYGENAEPKRRFNNSWYFDDNIRFERRWNYFGQSKLSA